MKVWLPFVVGGSGTDTFTRSLAKAFERAGHQIRLQTIPHKFQYMPDALSLLATPTGADVVLTNSWNGFAFRRAGVPMVTMEHLCVHDPVYAAHRGRLQAMFHRFVRLCERRSFEVADRVVAVSEATRRTVMEVFPGVDPAVIHNGVDTSFFSPSAAPANGSPRRVFRLLFVGNLTTRKGSDLLPKVMDALGDGFELCYTTGLREKSSLEIPNSRNLGRLDCAGVRAAYRSADALLFPTRLEGLSLTAIEAMACGLPIISSDATSMPEIVEDGMNGFLCKLEDPSAYAVAIRRLRDSPATLRNMSLAARVSAEERFSIARVASNYLDLFAKVMASRVG